MAAGVVLATLSVVWLQQEHRPQRTAHFYETAAGERETLRLADGSRVTLDADSGVDVRLTADRRSLVLKRGEAYFQVARDEARPFTVNAGATRVTALGTAFNVRMSDDRTIVAVTEGKVELAAPRLTAQIAAGEAVSYANGGNLQAIPAAEAPLATSWLEGRRQYRNEPLRYVLADVDRYTGRHIELGNEAAGELRFTGTLNLKNSEAWLRGLSVALPVTITEKDDGVRVMLDKEKMPSP